MRMRYIGKENPYFGEGTFTVGNEYEMLSDVEDDNWFPNARFIDDNGCSMWKEIDAFEPVDDGKVVKDNDY